MLCRGDARVNIRPAAGLVGEVSPFVIGGEHAGAEVVLAKQVAAADGAPACAGPRRR
jgi:hypothetical protein